MTTDADLVARLEWAEAAAFLSFYAAAEAAGSSIGAHAEQVDGVALATLDVLDAAFFNRAIGLGTVAPPTRTAVDAVSGAFRSRGRKQSLIHVPREVTTSALEGWLGEAGYRRGRNWVKLWHALDVLPEPATSLRIEQVGQDRADAFADIVVEAMGFPPLVAPLATHAIGAPGWRHYLGFDGDEPVSAAAMFVDGATAWLGFGATREAARGRGGQSALFARRLRDARELGCTMAVTETGEETAEEPVNHSYRNMLRSGFTLAYARPNWVRLEE